jgi:hypothetical protein
MAPIPTIIFAMVGGIILVEIVCTYGFLRRKKSARSHFILTILARIARGT